MIASVKIKSSEILAIPTTFLRTGVDLGSSFVYNLEAASLGAISAYQHRGFLSATVLVLLPAIPAAYYVGRNKFKTRTSFLLLVLVTQMFSPTSLVMGIFR
jgi:multiple sugar transport system permease protein